MHLLFVLFPIGLPVEGSVANTQQRLIYNTNGGLHTNTLKAVSEADTNLKLYIN
jgi:hypothetical protein